MSWQEFLHALQRKYNDWRPSVDFSDDGVHCTPSRLDGVRDFYELMQDSFPGPDRITKRFDLEQAIYVFDLEFDNPEEKILWMLKTR
jgi:hypothetical protein